MYEETLTGRPHHNQYKKLPVKMKMWMQFNVMPRTSENSCRTHLHRHHDHVKSITNKFNTFCCARLLKSPKHSSMKKAYELIRHQQLHFTLREVQNWYYVTQTLV